MSVLPDHLTRPSWRDHLHAIQRSLPADSLALQGEYRFLARWLANLPKTPDTFGLIHGDFELANLVWRHDKVGVLDFDDSAFLWYAADVAFAVRDLFDGEVDISDQGLQAFVEGYRESHPLSDVSLAQAPLFLRFARLWEYTRLMRSLDLACDPTQATWLVALRDKFTRRATEYRATLELQHAMQHG
jgi:Ser/Thr protein kinase RdoA (MazF antagonist)